LRHYSEQDEEEDAKLWSERPIYYAKMKQVIKEKMSRTKGMQEAMAANDLSRPSVDVSSRESSATTVGSARQRRRTDDVPTGQHQPNPDTI